MATGDDVRAQQVAVRDQSTNVAVAVEQVGGKLTPLERTDWDALAGACLTFVSAEVPLVFGVDAMYAQGKKLLSALAFWRQKVTDLGAETPNIDWRTAPHVAPAPGPGLVDQARSALTGPVGLLLMAYFALRNRR